MLWEIGDSPTPFSLMMLWVLVLAADIVAGEGAAKVPKRRENMDAMMGNWEDLRKEGGRRYG